MRNQGAIVLLVGLALMCHWPLASHAARKYYPPGFTPPVESKPPSQPPPSPPPPPSAPSSPSSTTIIKYVPVTVKVPVAKKVPTPTRDALLVLMDEHRYYDALRLVNARLKEKPTDIDLQIARGRILLAQGNFSQARNQFQALLDKGRPGSKTALSKPKRACVHNQLGLTFYQKAIYARQTGNMTDFDASMRTADANFRHAAQLTPSSAIPWVGLSKVAMAQGRLLEGGYDIRKAKGLSSKQGCVQETKLSLELAEAELLLLRQKPEEALQVLYGVKKTTTREPDVFLLLAKASMATGKVDDAIINLKQLLELTPDHTEALKLLSRSYELKMKPEDAEQVLEKAIALDPSDEASVNALLKIYEQHGKVERSLLLLKSLLKDRPENATYAAMLLRRLAGQNDWSAVYREGENLLPPILAEQPSSPTMEADQEEVVSLFARAAYYKRRAMLDNGELLKDPVVRQLRDFSRTRLNRVSGSKPVMEIDLNDRLNLVLLDPLASVPMLPSDFQPETRDDLVQALEITFLRGNQPLHARLLTQTSQREDKLEIARTLYEIGDFDGADMLASGGEGASLATTQDALKLKREIQDARKALQDNLTFLSLLPKKIPDAYWEKAASAALVTGCGDWKTHALISEALEKRHQPRLALLHQRLAAQYAQDVSEKQYWLRRANRTMRFLTRTRPSSSSSSGQQTVKAGQHSVDVARNQTPD